jgi:segregation and condensation protein A
MDDGYRACEAVESAIQVRVPAFEGPLDLLLHLIKKSRLNIYDIPIARITEDYLCSLEEMRSFNLETAGHFLEMAATLAFIKSRLLLPQSQEDEDDEEDPRLQVVRPLLVYACMQQAAVFLKKCPLLGVDHFRHGRAKVLLEEVRGEAPSQPQPLEVSLYDMLKAYWRLRTRSAQLQTYQITAERLSVTDRMQELFLQLKESGRQGIRQLCFAVPERGMLVVTFLALLEMIRSRVVRLLTDAASGEFTVALIESD